MWEVCFFTDEDKAASIIGNDKIENLKIVILEEIRTWLNVGNIHICIFSFFVKTKALGITQELCYRQSFTIIFLTGECPDQPIWFPQQVSLCYFLHLLYTVWEKNLQVNCIKIYFFSCGGYLLYCNIFGMSITKKWINEK